MLKKPRLNFGILKKRYCCERCQTYWTCETKWYRGERGEENICCPSCNFHTVCYSDIVIPKDKKK